MRSAALRSELRRSINEGYSAVRYSSRAGGSSRKRLADTLPPGSRFTSAIIDCRRSDPVKHVALFQFEKNAFGRIEDYMVDIPALIKTLDRSMTIGNYADSMELKQKYLDRFPESTELPLVIDATIRCFDPGKSPDNKLEHLQFISGLVIKGDLPDIVLYHLNHIPYKPFTVVEQGLLRDILDRFDQIMPHLTLDDLICGRMFNHEMQRKVVSHILKALGAEDQEAKIINKLEAYYGDHVLLNCRDKYFSTELFKLTRYLGETKGRLFIACVTAINRRIEHERVKINEDYELQMRPLTEQFAKESKDKLLSSMNNEEKRMLDDGVVRIKNHNGRPAELQVTEPAVSEAELRSVFSAVDNYYSSIGLVAQRYQLKHYEEAYCDLKNTFSIVPYFLEHIFNKFSGSFIFLDRDMRMFYEAVRKYGERLNWPKEAYLVPVSRLMVPDQYSEAYHINRRLSGSAEFFVHKGTYDFRDATPDEEFMPHSAEIESLSRKRRTGENKTTLKDVTGSFKFLWSGKPLLSYLSDIGALKWPRINVIDIGVLGTCAAYLRDVILRSYPDRKASAYLYYSAKDMPSFCKDLPNLGENAIASITRFERLPVEHKMVKRFIRMDGRFGPRWVPLYEEHKGLETHWIEELPNELDLAMKLVRLAMDNVMEAYIERRENND